VIDISASGLEEHEKHRDEVLAVKDHAIRSRSIEKKKTNRESPRESQTFILQSKVPERRPFAPCWKP